MANVRGLAQIHASRFALSVGAVLACCLLFHLPVASAKLAPIQKILMVPGFAEPFVATRPSTAAQDQALVKAIAVYRQRPEPDGFDAFERFLKTYPTTAWRTAVLTNLGFAYQHHGYFSKAMGALQLAWDSGRSATDPRAKAMTDRAISQLISMEAGFGDQGRLAASIQDLGNRPLSGQAKEAVDGARKSLWTMRNDPGVEYLCGPIALRNLVRATDASNKDLRFLDFYRSGPRGVSLAELARLADQAKIPYQIVYRETSQHFPIPAVIHWRLNHYAAIVAEKDGRVQIRDPMLGSDLWVTPDALMAESSGYFLIPSRDIPVGFRVVSATEAEQIRGMGPTYGQGKTSATTPQDDKAKPATCGRGMCGYNFHEMLVSLNLTDTPVGYAPRKGPPVFVTLTYNQREATQQANIPHFNIGPNWNLNWLSYIEDNPESISSPSAKRYVAGGGSITYAGFNSASNSFAAEARDASVLKLVNTNPIRYERRLSDGSTEVYDKSDGASTNPRHVFLTQIVDPTGNAVTLFYDSQLRLISILDAVGRDTTFSYGLSANPLLITKITDPFNRSAYFYYNNSGQLSIIKDVLGMISSVTHYPIYQNPTPKKKYVEGLIYQLKTPYGTTTFTYDGDITNNTWRSIQATDPLGHTERLEFRENAWKIPTSDPTVIKANIPASIEVTNNYLDYRNTFYWDKHALAVGYDYTNARIKHWNHDVDSSGQPVGKLADTIESIKYPLESRIWFNYEGSPISDAAGTFDLPTRIGRLLADGSWQVTQIEYNAQGRPTQIIDPVGRETHYNFDSNGIDLTEVTQKTSASGFDSILQLSSYALHRPGNIASAMTSFPTALTYANAGQVASTRSLLRNHRVDTTYVRDNLDRVTDIFVDEVDPTTSTHINSQLVFHVTYDAYDRIATSETESAHWVVVCDQNGRCERELEPGDTIKYDYDALDRIVRITYPDGTTRQYTWDKLDLVARMNRQQFTTTYTYDALRNLTAVSSPLPGLVTSYGYYDNGALHTLTDPAGRVTTWEIDVQSRVTAKRFADNTTVTIAYEKNAGGVPTTSRIKSVIDAQGQIKNYEYYDDNRIHAISYPNALHPTATVSFTYDQYYPRLAAMTDGLGTTTWHYYPPSNSGANFTGGGLQLQQEDGPYGISSDGSAYFQYDYFGRIVQSNGRFYSSLPPSKYDWLGRMDEYQTPLATFVQDYLRGTSQIVGRQAGNYATYWKYDSDTDDRRLLSISNSLEGRSFSYQTSPENLVSVITERLAGGQQISWGYTYDSADRLLTAQPSVGDSYEYTYDGAGNITSVRKGSSLKFAGYNSVNEITNFDGVQFVYDANGNLVDDGARTYQWDAENRLIEIGYKANSAQSTLFKYDGLGRRLSIIERNGATQTESRFTWCGNRICGARSFNGSSEVPTRGYSFAGQSNILNGGAGYEFNYYGQDRLASVRDVISSPAGTKIGSFDYDPYGLPLLSNATSSDVEFRFAGMFYHQPSGLYLTKYRAYDPRTMRWLSRDPIGERGGTNLYTYAANDPTNRRDPSGLYDPPNFNPSGIDLTSAGLVPAGIAVYAALTAKVEVVMLNAAGGVADIVSLEVVGEGIGASVAVVGGGTAAAGLGGAAIVGIGIGLALDAYVLPDFSKLLYEHLHPEDKIPAPSCRPCPGVFLPLTHECISGPPY